MDGPWEGRPALQSAFHGEMSFKKRKPLEKSFFPHSPSYAKAIIIIMARQVQMLPRDFF